MAAKTSPFTDHWRSRHADSKGKGTFILFPEVLLSTLYYQTDVGSIPRGIELPRQPSPQFFTNPNWRKEINGCYWCRSTDHSIQGVCCSKRCLYFLYEWCIDRIKHFTKEQMCILPGCSIMCKDTYVCCSSDHKKVYTGKFKEFPEIKRDKNFSPRWYDSNLKLTPTKPTQALSNRISLTKPSPLPKMDIPIGFKSLLIYETDVGPIPRSYKQEQHLMSPYSSSPNWHVDIPAGCYQCAEPINNNREFLCSKKCHILFCEWCRRKVSKSNQVFCKYTACSEIVSPGETSCKKDHERDSKKAHFKSLLDAQIDEGPKWYVSSHSNVPTISPTNVPIISPITNVNSPQKVSKKFKNQFLFSPLLTKFLYKDCDVGPIPRKLLEQLSDVDSPCGLANGNWNAIIPGCYWCCTDDQSIHGIVCSNSCFYLFNEWCHEKLRKSNSKRLCKFLSCDSTANYSKDCCKREHTDKYNNTFVFKYSHDLKSSNYALGPRWYFDKSSNHVDFYNREDPFYEFTNFFACSNLIIDQQCWATTEHYYQAQKFVGTPHCESIRRLSSPRDAFEYARIPNVQCWIRRDWSTVNESVMLKALQVKFSQDEFLKDLLIRTGDKQLFQHTRNDRFSGDGGDGRGENKLGILLMQVRREFQAADKYPVYQQNPMFQNNVNNQTLLTCEVNNQKSNVVQSGVTNTDRQKFFKNSSPHPSQTNTPPLDSKSNTPSSSLQPSAPPSNTNSKYISNVSNGLSSTNPFCNQAHVGYSKTADVVSKPSSTKPGIYDITPGQKLWYDAKHELPNNYFNPFGLKDPGSEEIEACQNENSPLLSRNASNLVDDDHLMETDQTGDSKDKNKPEQSNVQLIWEAQSDSSVFTSTASHLQYDEINPFLKELVDEPRIPASDTETGPVKMDM